MNFRTDKIYHGAAYYPEVWTKKEIEHDISIMKQLGINVVRIAEFAWSQLEPKKDVFNIGLFDEAIELFGKNGIMTVMGTPTATPPRWFTAENPDSLYLDRNMVRAHHGSREHVCFNSPQYVARTEIIVRKLAEHYGKNPYVIAWQVHNEYNCPPVNECVCDNCKKAWQSWLKAKYGTVENMNEKWGAGVWSTAYDCFENVLPPRPTPNGHSASIGTAYTRFTYDSVAKYNALQVKILKEYVSVPITHNTNRVFHIDQESVFEPLDFVSYDDYSIQDNWQEAVFAAELCRTLKAGEPFWEMETSASYSANLFGRAPYHKRGYVKAQAVNGFFAGSVGFSYWLFRQHRAGTEMPHSHIVTAWGALSECHVNVQDVSSEIRRLERFLLGTKPEKADVALIYSDVARAFCSHEGLSSVNYPDDVYAFYRALLKTSAYRDVVYEGGDFNGYRVIFAPYLMHVSETLREKLIAAAKAGATVVFGPYSGWRTDDHTYETERAFGKLEEYFGGEIKDVAHFYGQDASYEVFGKKDPIDCIGAVLDQGEGVIRGGYYDGKSFISEKACGKGKIVFLGAKLSPETMETFVAKVVAANTESVAECEDGVVMYKRSCKNERYLCFVNMSKEEKTVRFPCDRKEYFSGKAARSVKLEPYGNAIYKE